MGHERSRSLPRVLAVVLILVVMLGPVLMLRDQLALLLSNPNAVAEQIRGTGPAGPLVVIALTVLQVVSAPIPGPGIQFVGGYLYGFWAGLLYTEVGMVLGTGIAMGLGRIAGRPLLRRILSPDSMRRIDNFATNRGLRFFFLVFLFPFLPDDLLCYAAGLTALPIPAVLLVAAIGRLPMAATGVWAGANAGELGLLEWALLGGLSLAGFLLTWRYGRRLGMTGDVPPGNEPKDGSQGRPSERG